VDTTCAVNVYDVGKKDLLQGLAFIDGPIPDPDSDAAALNAFNSPSVKSSEDEGVGGGLSSAFVESRDAAGFSSLWICY